MRLLPTDPLRRIERDQAMRDWAAAVTLWRSHALPRLFGAWRGFGRRKLALAVATWMAAELARGFRCVCGASEPSMPARVDACTAGDALRRVGVDVAGASQGPGGEGRASC